MNKPMGFVLAAGLATLLACGSSRPLTGGWNAQLQNPDTSTALTFFADLKQSGSTVNVSNFGSGPTGTIAACFGGSGLSEFANMSGGHFAMTVSTLFPTPTNNTFTLNGTQTSGGTISGTWTSSGQSGCAGSGSFSMSGVPPV